MKFLRRYLARRRLAKLLRPDPALIAKVVEYNPSTGALTWVAAPDASDFVSDGMSGEQKRRAFSNRIGKPAFATKMARGYHKGRFMGREYFAHRIAWVVMTGEWPEAEIDHINGRRNDNRWCNLRSVTRAENNRNAAIPSNNTSGCIGVSWSKRDQRWSAFIKVSGRRYGLGNFKCFDDAVAARKDAEVAYGFHPNHGRERDWRNVA